MILGKTKDKHYLFMSSTLCVKVRFKEVFIPRNKDQVMFDKDFHILLLGGSLCLVSYFSCMYAF